MAKYLNTSMSIQEFYGIEIKPHQVKAFPGYVNRSYMIRVSDETPETTDEKQSSGTAANANKSTGTSSAKSATKSETTSK